MQAVQPCAFPSHYPSPHHPSDGSIPRQLLHEGPSPAPISLGHHSPVRMRSCSDGFREGQSMVGSTTQWPNPVRNKAGLIQHCWAEGPLSTSPLSSFQPFPSAADLVLPRAGSAEGADLRHLQLGNRDWAGSSRSCVSSCSSQLKMPLPSSRALPFSLPLPFFPLLVFTSLSPNEIKLAKKQIPTPPSTVLPHFLLLSTKENMPKNTPSKKQRISCISLSKICIFRE